MKREFGKLTEGRFDLLVIGGGVYGAWVSYDAALRGLRATSAATVQLSVPAIAAIGGVILLSEPVTLRRHERGTGWCSPGRTSKAPRSTSAWVSPGCVQPATRWTAWISS